MCESYVRNVQPPGHISFNPSDILFLPRGHFSVLPFGRRLLFRQGFKLQVVPFAFFSKTER